METRHCSWIKILTVSFPLIYFLISWNFSVAASIPSLPQPSSAILAAETLRTRGYSLFASVLSLSTTTTYNFSGTLLAPPDFAFSFAAAKFLNNRRPPPRPSISLLLYHTLKPPRVLTWSALSSLNSGEELHTLYNNNCLFISRTFGGELLISTSPFVNPISAVKIRQPDLYVDDHLTVHGIDFVLDPTFASKCHFRQLDPTPGLVPPKVNRTFLDHAMRALRRTGFTTVAAAMGVRRSELLSLNSITIFAVSDNNFFLKPNGFRYDFRHHVVPLRHRIAGLRRLTEGGTAFETLAPNKTVLVDSVDGAVNVDGISVDRTEVYHNRWIVVVSVAMSLDDVFNYEANPPVSDEAPSPSPAINGGDISSAGAPSPVAELDNAPSFAPDILSDDYLNTSSSISPYPESTASQESDLSPTPLTVSGDVSGTHCDMNDVISFGVEGGDLFCPVSRGRELRESESLTDVHVELTQPSDGDDQAVGDSTWSEKVRIAENVNIADDLFFYI